MPNCSPADVDPPNALPCRHREKCCLLRSCLQPHLQPVRLPVATALYYCDMDTHREEKLKMQRVQCSESLVLNDITGQPEPSEVIPGNSVSFCPSHSHSRSLSLTGTPPPPHTHTQKAINSPGAPTTGTQGEQEAGARKL